MNTVIIKISEKCTRSEQSCAKEPGKGASTASPSSTGGAAPCLLAPTENAFPPHSLAYSVVDHGHFSEAFTNICSFPDIFLMTRPVVQVYQRLDEFTKRFNSNPDHILLKDPPTLQIDL